MTAARIFRQVCGDLAIGALCLLAASGCFAGSFLVLQRVVS